MQRLECRSSRAGGDSSREDERPGHVSQPVRHAMGGQHTSADGRQRLGESEHGDVHFVRQTEMRRSTAATGTEHTETVRIVHHHAGIIFLRQRTYLRQFADVAAHGEYSVRDNQFACVLRDGLELPLQILHVRMAIAQYFRETQTAGIVDRSMVLAVIEDIVVLAADSGDDSEVGLEARRNGHTLFVPREFRQLFLQLQVQVQGTVQETAAGDACTVFVQRLMTGFDNRLVLCETEVVIRTQHDDTVVLHLHHRGLTALQLVEVRIDL